MPHITPAPIQRSDLRLWLGTRYFRFCRWLWWHNGNIKMAKLRDDLPCDIECASHRTPLIRRLKDVDMYLQENKVHNLRLAVAKLDGMVLLPGESLSYWKCIGNPTKRKGYKEGMLLKNGSVTAAMGGGLCQLSNLIYWMTLHTPLTVTERHRHSYDVFPDADRTQPFGSGATCFYNYLDLMIRNDTSHPYRLSLYVGEHYLEGAWYSDASSPQSYEIYEAEHYMQGEYWGGFTRHNQIRRRVFDRDGTQVDDQYVAENHAIMMYDPFLEAASSQTK